MNTFKKKSLCAALAGLGALGMVGAAQAVSINPDGLGQVLIYPYYTVRANADGDTFNSLLSIVNSTDEGKAVKVRFLEGKASHEVLDFNLYLSPYDVWAAAVFDNGSGASIKTSDTSCTYGNLLAQGDAGQAFRNSLFSSSLADGEDASLDRTREGYVELIEMAEIIKNSPTYTAIKHAADADGKWAPPNCAAVKDGGHNAIDADQWAKDDLTTPKGGLFGGMTVLNPRLARAAGYEATALNGFFDSTTVAGDLPGAPSARVAGTLWFPSGTMNPNLSMAYPANSIVVDGNFAVINTGWRGTDFIEGNPVTGVPATAWKTEGARRSVYLPGLDAVAAVLTRSTIMNEYMTADSVGGATDWVVTMPTKGLHFDRATDQLEPRSLFQNVFAKGGSCDSITFGIYSREEQGEVVEDGEGWSPVVDPTAPGASLCWEANVIEIKGPSSADRSVFHSENVNKMASEYDNGWAILNIKVDRANLLADYDSKIINAPVQYAAHLLDATGTRSVIDLRTGVAPAVGVLAPTGATYNGLPMVGFATQLFNNKALESSAYGKVWASYASRMDHRYQRDID